MSKLGGKAALALMLAQAMTPEGMPDPLSELLPRRRERERDKQTPAQKSEALRKAEEKRARKAAKRK